MRNTKLTKLRNRKNRSRERFHRLYGAGGGAPNPQEEEQGEKLYTVSLTNGDVFLKQGPPPSKEEQTK